MVGIKDRRLSEKLQLDPKLTLEKATQQVKHSELVSSRQGIIHGNSEPIKIDRVVKTQNAPERKQTVTRHSSVTQRDNKPQKHCSRCLGEPHSQKQCPARDAVCHNCKKKGHWSKACRNTCQVSEVKEEYDSDPYFMGEVTLIDTVESRSKVWTASIHIAKEQIEFKLDSGADVTVLPEITYHKLQVKPKLQSKNKVLLGPCNYSTQKSSTTTC